jgi:hypothetical protein
MESKISIPVGISRLIIHTVLVLQCRASVCVVTHACSRPFILTTKYVPLYTSTYLTQYLYYSTTRPLNSHQARFLNTVYEYDTGQSIPVLVCIVGREEVLVHCIEPK